ncbi:hypothetical protein ACO2RV_04475 [Ancylobacter sp. VNQ12]|uniref:hypothetical protein n=1 Tax=Ancylobacter sp. VNQ12 TaxID=3400920 RepID=UPI003C0A0A9D
MIGAILRWLTGDVLGKLTQAYVAAKSSAVESERIKADILLKQIDAEMAARQAALQVRLATAGFWEMRFITALIAGCFTLHLVLVTLDTCFRLGWRIPAFPSPFDEWQGAILLSFFGIYAAGTSAKAIAVSLASKGR